MVKHSKIEAEIAQAKEHSDAWIEAIPESAAKRRANATRIAEVYQRLVSARPIQEPTYGHIAEEGTTLHSGFPAENYVQNHFRQLVRYWRVAYQRIFDVSAPVPVKRGEAFEILQESLGPLDSGTRAMVNLVQTYAKNPKKENDRLREIISGQHSVPGRRGEQTGGSDRTPVLDANHLNALRTWQSDLKEGRNGLESTEAGIRTSRLTRPGTLIIPEVVLEATQAVCRDASSLTDLSSASLLHLTGLSLAVKLLLGLLFLLPFCGPWRQIRLLWPDGADSGHLDDQRREAHRAMT